jgi:aldehyde:ferredoxin oxidoreductase
MSGNFNRMLEVDLSSGEPRTYAPDPDDMKIYVGGSALAARLFYEEKGYKADPLSPENPLFVMTGPMVGTNFPGTSRFVVCARSPLTGIWGESTSGGTFGAELKKAGFDGIFLKGRAEQPSYVFIEDDRVSVLEAGSLWGSDTYDAVDYLRERHGGRHPPRVIVIGVAGENMVRYAAICNDKAHYFGRTGMGAVMGSKNLKAIVVKGTGKVPIAHEKAYASARKAALENIKDSMISDSFREMGTAAAMDLGMMTGDVPIKNWSLGVDYDMADELGGPAQVEKLLKGRTACFSCPIGCKPVVGVTGQEYDVPRGPGPEYETCATFGTMLMNNNLYAVAKANELCNRLGLDTITCGSTLAFIMEAYEKGYLKAEDTDGLEMTWGNMDAVLSMLHKIAHREGFGDRAAEGSYRLAKSIGEEVMGFVVTIKGLELPMHDPRGFHGMGLAYMNSNRGACHLQHSAQAVEQGMVLWTEAGLEEDYPATESAGKAKMVYICEDLGQMTNIVCVCHFVHWAMGLRSLLEGFNAVTGYEFGMEEFMKTGRRAWVMKRALNNLMGISSEDDILPARILTPLSEGGAEGSVPDEGLMKKEYYEICGLDKKGYPSIEVLNALDLEFFKNVLF